MLKRQALIETLLVLALIALLAGCQGRTTPTIAPATAAPTVVVLPTITRPAPVSPLPTPGSASPLPTPGLASPLPTPVTAAAAGTDYEPLTGPECEELRALVGETLGKKPDTGLAKFQDIKTGQAGEGCVITLTGTGVDFGSFLDTAQKLQTAFEEAGWEVDLAYLADGPTGTAFGLRKDTKLALVSVGWDPAEGVRCPTDFPISACNITPEQQLFTITVNVATQ
jgi:hypothetical protein